MPNKTLDSLFYDTLKDIYYAERKLLTALKKMARGAESEELKEAFTTHHAQTEDQIERLQKVFEMIGKQARGKTCEAIEGIIAEGEDVMDDFKDEPALDAGIIASAQAAEHYEMARYGTLVTWANLLDMGDAAKLLQQNLDEGIETDALLTQLAEKSANPQAVQAAAN